MLAHPLKPFESQPGANGTGLDLNMVTGWVGRAAYPLPLGPLGSVNYRLEDKETVCTGLGISHERVWT